MMDKSSRMWQPHRYRCLIFKHGCGSLMEIFTMAGVYLFNSVSWMTAIEFCNSSSYKVTESLAKNLFGNVYL